MIFEKCLSEGTFPNFWKFANVQHVHKKDSRQIKSNYRPISLLPICGNILEKIVVDKLYAFLNTNDLISSDQFGFCPGDSTINQLILSHQTSLKLLKTLTKLVHYSLTYLKPLIKFGMKA